MFASNTPAEAYSLKYYMRVLRKVLLLLGDLSRLHFSAVIGIIISTAHLLKKGGFTHV